MGNNETLKQAASIGRFFLLLIIWGWIGYFFKIFMDLTIGGFITNVVFFAASAVVVVGFKTRLGMLALALSILAHAFEFHHRISAVLGVMALGAALLPVGAYYSLDRYRALTAKPMAYVPIKGADVERPSPSMMALFVLFAAFIVGGPTYNQMFHHDFRYFRSWVMFNSIGNKLVNVDFFTVKNGVREDIDYIAKLGYKPPRPGVHVNKMVRADVAIIGTEQLQRIIGRMCGAVPDPASLRLEAKMATRKNGWKPLYNGSEAICTGGNSGETL